MIDAKEKEKEESDKSKTVEESEVRLVKFWALLKNRLKENNLDYLERVSPKPHYSLGFWKGNGKYAFCIGRHTFRVELYFSNDSNKELIDAMSKYEDVIESSFDGKIEWERLENKKASRIKFEKTKEQISLHNGKFSDETYWDDLINWYVVSMDKFYKTINPYLDKIQ
jgi:hypothetical protein